ncbi:MAG: HNH endonuclease signature motif containing protein [Clostridia bacterium]|nr:HNH endonuclease signature motif containing protein [Clostridia bacterium]MDD4697500.1 HNH endonuclease signature motif containing protein [Fermentimonas sp.]
MTTQQKLDSLTEESVWIFTKQTTDFDDAFRATRLFNDAFHLEVNLEDFFSSHYSEYGITTDRHRVWIISQLFGLMTKTPFYSRGPGSFYANERPTAVFDLINQCEIGDENYNVLKSEQLLKVRIKAIIDTSPNRYDQVLLPLLFSYLTLRELSIKYNITDISLDQFYTYIATCKRFSEVEETAFLLSQNPNISSFVQEYKDRSRIKPLFNKNSNLLDFSNNRVKINPNFDEYLHENLVSKLDLKDLELILEDPNAYAYFLYNCQNFNVNIIDKPAENLIITDNITPLKNILEISNDNETYDSAYVEKVDEVKEENINIEIAKDAYKNEPRFSDNKQGVKILKNPIFGKIAIKQSEYKCNANESHTSFESKKTKRHFMEAHHLIPMNKAKDIFEEQNINIDCVENLVSLCPNCHRASHYGSNIVKRELLTNLYNKKVNEYQNIGLNISLEELMKMYGI